MNTINSFFTSWNLVGSSGNPSNDGREIITKKFEKTLDSNWWEKVSADAKLSKAVVVLPVASLIDGFNDMGFWEKSTFINSILASIIGSGTMYASRSFYAIYLANLLKCPDFQKSDESLQPMLYLQILKSCLCPIFESATILKLGHYCLC